MIAPGDRYDRKSVCNGRWTNVAPHQRRAVRSTGERPLKYLARSVDALPGTNLSIRAKILISLCIVIVLMSVSNVLILLQWLNYSRQYDAIINNITVANSIGGHIKADIDTEMWKVVSGKINFQDGRQYRIIQETNAQLQQMIANTDSHRARVKLDVIGRTLQSLTEQIDLMGQQIERKSTADENEAILEQIRFVSTVLEEVVQDYTLFEVQRTEQQYQQMRQSLARWQLWFVVVMFGAVGFLRPGGLGHFAEHLPSDQEAA